MWRNVGAARSAQQAMAAWCASGCRCREKQGPNRSGMESARPARGGSRRSSGDNRVAQSPPPQAPDRCNSATRYEARPAHPRRSLPTRPLDHRLLRSSRPAGRVHPLLARRFRSHRATFPPARARRNHEILLGCGSAGAARSVRSLRSSAPSRSASPWSAWSVWSAFTSPTAAQPQSASSATMTSDKRTLTSRDTRPAPPGKRHLSPKTLRLLWLLTTGY